MKKLDIVYFSVTSNEIPNLSAVVTEFDNNIAPLILFARTRTQLDASKNACYEFVQKALNADVLMVTLMSGSRSCPAWDELIKALELNRSKGIATPYFHVQPTGSNEESMEMVQKFSHGVNTGLWKTLNQYYRYGGRTNLLQMLISLYNQVFNDTIPAAEAKAGPEKYMPWHQKLPEKIKDKMTRDWGKMPGDLFVHNNELLFSGMINGNIFLTIQPPRGYLEQIDKLYHDPLLSPLEKVHGYLSEISDTTITKGLHILGSAPKDQDLIDTLVQLTRLSNGNIPSLRTSIIIALGYNMDLVLENRKTKGNIEDITQ